MCYQPRFPSGPPMVHRFPTISSNAAFPTGNHGARRGPALLQQTFEDLGSSGHPLLPSHQEIGLGPLDEALDDARPSFFLFLFYGGDSTPAGLNLIDGRSRLRYVVDGLSVEEADRER